MRKLADYLNLALPYIPPELIAPQNRDELHMVSSQFPADWSRCFDFECRLSASSMPVDFLFCVTQKERSALTGPAFLQNLPAGMQDHALWKNINQFIQAWANPGSILHQKVLMVWFEFDLPGWELSSVSPGFFFGSNAIPSNEPGDSDSSAWIFDTALKLLYGKAQPVEVEHALRNIIDCMPAGAHLYQIGLFPARSVAMLRACLTGIAPREIVPYLQKIHCPADFARLEQLIAELAPLCQIYIDLDITTSGVRGKVGLECSQDRGNLIGLGERDSRFLDYLYHAGICDASQREALMRYSGYQDQRSFPQDWSATGSTQNLGDRSGEVETIRRDLSHIKLVVQPGLPIEAKAYLQVVHDQAPVFTATQYGLAYQAMQKETERILNSFKNAL